ncbi:uncharacterized protein [Pempheris klunzingeri]|uniref:uncharacterized protein n=1 Tax=Pempheris klunzingeri TaxID=3127111 RepID=UPI0039803681
MEAHFAPNRARIAQSELNVLEWNRSKEQEIQQGSIGGKLLRQELKSLRCQFKAAKEEERPALSELTNIVRKKLITLRRAEWHRRKGKERARKQSAFIGNPFAFTKRLLGQKRSSHLACPVGEIDHHLNEARESKGDLATVWLDLTNAYGSIPHKLVHTALTRHHVPGNVCNLIMDYYSDFSARVSSNQVTSGWHCLEKGIITGCTISVSLFSLAMNMIVKSAEVECRGPKSRSGTWQPPIRAFMDDLTVMTTSVPGCRWLLQGLLQRLISWAKMSFKPAKSRSLVLKKGKVADHFHLTLGGTKIPTVTEKPVKSLGKIFDSSLKDAAALQQTKSDLTSWLTAIDKSGLPGKFKAWMYQHGVLPRILWPLLIYEVPMTTVEALEKTISQFLRRWLGLPRSLSSIALYGHSTKLHLPLSGLSEEFKVTRSREVMMYRDSADAKVASAGIVVKTGRMWQAQEAVSRAEAQLRHKSLVGTVAMGRAGLGSFPRPRYDRTCGKEKRQLVQDEIRAEVEEQRCCKMVGMSKQGAWTRWEHVEPRKLTWAELWRAEPLRTKFLIQSVYDVLPSPANLHTWGLADTPGATTKF